VLKAFHCVYLFAYKVIFPHFLVQAQRKGTSRGEMIGTSSSENLTSYRKFRIQTQTEIKFHILNQNLNIPLQTNAQKRLYIIKFGCAYIGVYAYEYTKSLNMFHNYNRIFADLCWTKYCDMMPERWNSKVGIEVQC
jgi:hypothetical protein